MGAAGSRGRRSGGGGSRAGFGCRLADQHQRQSKAQLKTPGFTDAKTVTAGLSTMADARQKDRV